MHKVRIRPATSFPYDPHGLPTVIDVDPADGRVFIREMANDTALLLLRDQLVAIETTTEATWELPGLLDGYPGLRRRGKVN